MSFTISLMISCSGRTLEDVCTQDFPRLESEVTDASLSLQIVQKRLRTYRRIASDPKDSRSEERLMPRMAVEERGKWAKWGRSSLHRVQSYMDVVEENPELLPIKKELMKVANDLVHFHGHAEAGNLTRMVKMLDQIRFRSLETRKRLCGFRVSQLEETSK